MSVLNVDNDYGREVEALLTPEVIEGLQRAALVLRVALDDVRSAMDVMEPLQEEHQAICLRRADGGDTLDDVGDALRERTPWGRAIDLTFEILDEVKRVAY